VDEGLPRRLVRLLERRGVAVERFGWDTPAAEGDGDFDLVFVLGGDGSMLRAARLYPGRVLVGVNLGRVGFLSGMSPGEMEFGVEKVLDGRFGVQECRMLEVRREGDGYESRLAVNDAVLVKREPHRITEIELSVGGEWLASLRCDGFVAATPLGSTAYALSAGGPIVSADVDAFVLVPIAPHSLLTRSLVLGSDQVAELRVTERGALLSVDGADPEEVPDGGRVIVGLSRESVRIGRTDEWGPWRALKKTFL
jgi:NAD+ kinase